MKRPKDRSALDGLRAHQLHLVRSAADDALPPEARRRRDELELAIAALRETKSSLAEDAYYQRLEPLALELARLYAKPHEPRVPSPSEPSR